MGSDGVMFTDGVLCQQAEIADEQHTSELVLEQLSEHRITSASYLPFKSLYKYLLKPILTSNNIKKRILGTMVPT